MEWMKLLLHPQWRKRGQSLSSPPVAIRPTAASRKRLQNRHQDTRPKKGDQEATPEMKRACDTQETGYRSSNECTYETNHDVKKTTVAAPTHDNAGEKAC